MVNKNLIKALSQIGNTQLVSKSRVDFMLVEKLFFGLDRLQDRDFVVDLFLGSVFDAKVSEFEWVDIASEKIYGICALIH